MCLNIRIKYKQPTDGQRMYIPLLLPPQTQLHNYPLTHTILIPEFHNPHHHSTSHTIPHNPLSPLTPLQITLQPRISTLHNTTSISTSSQLYRHSTAQSPPPPPYTLQPPPLTSIHLSNCLPCHGV